MIRNENEYKEAAKRLTEEKDRLDASRKQLKANGLTPSQIKRAIDPMESFHRQLVEEVESYERLKNGVFDEIRNLRGIGRLLIGLRIAQGLSQRELAERMGVSESQVSRDERNEYHGVTLERAARILDLLQADVRLTVACKL